MPEIPFDREYSDNRSSSRLSHRLRARKNRYSSFRHITPSDLPSAPTPQKHYHVQCNHLLCFSAGDSKKCKSTVFSADICTVPLRTFTKREAYTNAQDKNHWRSAPKEEDWRGWRRGRRGLCVARKRVREGKEAREYVKDQYIWGEEKIELEEGGHGNCEICLGIEGEGEFGEPLVGPSETYFGARAVPLAACAKGAGDEGYVSEEVGEEVEEEVAGCACGCVWRLQGRKLWAWDGRTGQNLLVDWDQNWDRDYCCALAEDEEEYEEEEVDKQIGETIEDVEQTDEEGVEWDLLSVAESAWTEVSADGECQ